MGKITVKHYLNTNLKPYVINGEKYYSIYILVTANRQNTKIKSTKFEELYTEHDFAEIIEESNPLINDETSVITNISNLIIDILGEFDTSFFSALYGFIDNVYIHNLDIQMHHMNDENYTGEYRIDLYKSEGNAFGLNLELFIFGEFSKSTNRSNGMSVFSWFSDKGQTELNSFLSQNIPDFNIEELQSILNKLIFYACLDKFQWALKGVKKYESLYQKYEIIFDDYYGYFFDDITKKYGYHIDEDEINKEIRKRAYDKF